MSGQRQRESRPGWHPTWAWASGRASPWGHVGLWLLYQNPLLLLCPKGSFPFILSSQEDEGNSKDHLCLTHAYRVLFSEKRFTILGVSSLFLFFSQLLGIRTLVLIKQSSLFFIFYFSMAAITTYYRLGNVNYTNLVLTAVEAQSLW